MRISDWSSDVCSSDHIRIPAPGWKPDGWTPPVKQNAMISQNHVHIEKVLKTPQFWLVWWVLTLNVNAGIGVIGQASVMLQECFKCTVSVAAAACFGGLVSLGYMLGDWQSTRLNSGHECATRM